MSRKIIYIEGLALVDDHFSGVGQYTLGLVRGIDNYLEEKHIEGDDSLTVKILCPKDRVHMIHDFGFKYVGVERLRTSYTWLSRKWVNEKQGYIDVLRPKGHYLFARFSSMPLLRSNFSQVIYDLSYETHREHSDINNAKFLSRVVKKSLQKTKHVFTISNSVKGELIDFYDELTEDNVSVIYPTVDKTQFYKRTDAEIDRVKNKYGAPKKYILALSNLEPRKNLNGLVDAYCNLPKEIIDNVGLMIVGVNGWKTQELFNKIRKKVSEGYSIVRPNMYVSDADKPAFISGAEMLVYPSHYEGFGIPPVEALSCDVPVIAADNSSLPEAVGKAGTLIDGSNKSIEKAIIAQYKKNKSSPAKNLKQALSFDSRKLTHELIETIYRIEQW